MRRVKRSILLSLSSSWVSGVSDGWPQGPVSEWKAGHSLNEEPVQWRHIKVLSSSSDRLTVGDCGDVQGGRDIELAIE